MDLWYIGFRSICKNKYMVVKMVKLHTKVVLLCSQTFLSECCCTEGLWALCCLPSVFLKSRGVNSVNRNPYILRISSHHLHVTCTVSTAHGLNSICSSCCVFTYFERLILEFGAGGLMQSFPQEQSYFALCNKLLNPLHTQQAQLQTKPEHTFFSRCHALLLFCIFLASPAPNTWHKAAVWPHHHPLYSKIECCFHFRAGPTPVCSES